MNRESILAYRSRPKTTTVPAFGGNVTVRQISTKTVLQLQRAQQAAGGGEGEFGSLINWIIYTVVDSESLEPVFEDTPEDRAAIMELPISELSRVATAAAELNGATPGAVRELAKN